MNPSTIRMQQKLQEREALHAQRKLRLSPNLIDFSSNDYLGLGQIIAAEQKHLGGSGGSRLLHGNSIEAERLETWLARQFLSEAALVFNSGYTANLGFFSCVPQKNDVVFYDELIHASVRDGLRMSDARSFSFRHNNIESLCEKAARQQGRIFVAVESVYSMDGDRAPLEELNTLCAEKGWLLVVDEAHALGIFGPEGKGMVSGLPDSTGIFARILTFGKAAGFHGAAILGSDILKAYLINFSRPFIYSTALPPNDYNLMQMQIQRLLDSNLERAALNIGIECWKNSLGSNFNIQQGPIQIVPALSNTHADALSQKLSEAGFDVRAIKHPTVALGSERLRVIVHAFNSESEIKQLAKSIQELYDFF